MYTLRLGAQKECQQPLLKRINVMSNFSEKEYTLLRTCELLKDLSDKNFNTFLNLSERISHDKGKVLLQEGKPNEHLFIVLSGTVDLYKATGIEQYLIGNLSNGQSIGEMRVVKNLPCSLTVITSAPTVVLSILVSKLHHMEYNQCYESILDAIINILCHRLTATNALAADGKNKKKSWRKYIFPALFVTTLALLLCELGVAYYYLM
jgi:CRP/FNR family transcriptional regulator, cyclic AMP receptor protein